MGWSSIGMGGMLLAGIEKQYFILTTWLGVCRICLSMNSVFDRLPCNYSVSVKTKVRPVATAWKLILLDVVSVSRRSMARLGTHRWTSVRRIPDTYLLTTGAVFRSIGKLAILLNCLSVSRTATGVGVSGRVDVLWKNGLPSACPPWWPFWGEVVDRLHPMEEFRRWRKQIEKTHRKQNLPPLPTRRKNIDFLCLCWLEELEVGVVTHVVPPYVYLHA